MGSGVEVGVLAGVSHAGVIKASSRDASIICLIKEAIW